MTFNLKNKTLKSLLKNKYILYLVALIALIYILSYIMKQEFSAILFFYLVGMITYNYTKNMTIVLLTSLLVTTSVHLSKNMLILKEGMSNTDTSGGNTDISGGNTDISGGNTNTSGNTSGFLNHKLTPGLFTIPNKAQLEKQLGEADKIETAYDNLEKVIGENGIKSMSDSTKELVRQQNELLKGLKNITPALNEAMGAITKIDLNMLKNMFDSTKSNIKE